MKLKILLGLVLVFVFLGSKNFAYSQNINITASVNPDANDLQFDFEALTAQEVFPQNSTIEYQLTYGSNAFSPIPITLEANWEEGTIENAMTSVGVVNYVDGSATNAYGNTQPVIDLINNRITWTISSYPGQTNDEIVKYSVRTNNSYKGSNLVNFLNKAKLTSVSLELAEISIGKKYLYNSSLEPAATLAPTSNQASQNSTNATNTPVPAINNLSPTLPIRTPAGFKPQITQILLRTVTANMLKIYIETDTGSRMNLFFGHDKRSLNRIINNQRFTTNNEFIIEDLEPDTEYFIMIEAANRRGEVFKSDIYTFRTAKASDYISIAGNSIIITSENNILTNPKNLEASSIGNLPVIVLPSNQIFEFKFNLDRLISTKRVQIFIRNKDVLGINTYSNMHNMGGIIAIDAIEISQGVYAGSLSTPDAPGNYEVIARISDRDGNIIEQKLADLRVSKKMKVINSSTKKPVEGARIYLSYFNPTSKNYVMLPSQLFRFKNPMHTNINGELDIALAEGKYLAEVSAIGYENNKTEFVIGMNPNEDYPEIVLKEEPFNILSTSIHFWSIFIDAVSETKQYIQNLSNSNRFFEFNALISLGILVVFTMYSFLSKFNIPLGSFFAYITHHTKTAAGDAGSRGIIWYKLYDNIVKHEISGADVYLIDKNKNKVLNHIKTDSKGEFRLGVIWDRDYLIEIMKDGYQPLFYDVEHAKPDNDHPSIIFYNDKISINKAVKNLKRVFKNFAGFIFEILLSASLIFELSLGLSLGWMKTLPFITVSIINILIWFLILYSKRQVYR